MKRGIIYNNRHTIVIPNEEIWMTAWEIADLFYVTPISINHVIKRILKEKVLIESQVHRYICLEMGIMQMYIIWRWSLPYPFV